MIVFDLVMFGYFVLFVRIVLMAGAVWLVVLAILFAVEQARQVVYRIAVDVLEISARAGSQKDDQLRRDIKLAEAGLQLRRQRLELQGQRLELLEMGKD